MQTIKQSHAEVALNQFVGIIGGFLIVLFLFPLFDDLEQIWIATISSVIFFVWSYARSYLIRRWFNGRKTAQNF